MVVDYGMSIERIRERYWTHGWVVVPEVYEIGEIEPILRLAMEVAQNEAAAEGADDADTDLDEHGKPIPRKIMYPFTKSEHFRRFVLSSQLTGLIGALLGKEPRLVFDQVFLKPPRHGSAKPYHQDNAYFRCQPADEVLTAWIALDDVDESNGCLRYIDGSHRMPMLEHAAVAGEQYNITPAEDDIDLSLEVAAPVPRGGVVFHHGQALHTSHPNRSDRWRRGYATHWVTDDVSSDSDTLENAFFVRYPEYFEQ